MSSLSAVGWFVEHKSFALWSNLKQIGLQATTYAHIAQLKG